MLFYLSPGQAPSLALYRNIVDDLNADNTKLNQPMFIIRMECNIGVTCKICERSWNTVCLFSLDRPWYKWVIATE